MLAADVDAAAAATPVNTIRLLPGFDQYVVAAPRGAEAILAAEHRARVYRPQGWISPAVVVDGRIAGVWEHEAKGGAVTVTVTPFARPDAALREGVEAEAERLAAFLGGALALVWQ
jgi:hypothetical protein